MAADADLVAVLAGQLGYLVTPTEVRSRLAVIQDYSSNAHGLFVAEISGRVCGWVEVHRDMPSLLAENRAEIRALVVDEATRGQGVGRTLLHHAEKWAQTKSIWLRSNISRERAHQFYLREGYEIYKTSHIFRKTLK